MADDAKGTFGYWERRAVEQDAAMHHKLNAPEKIIINAYIEAQEYLKAQSKQIYYRYSGQSSELSESQIRAILNGRATDSEVSELLALAKTVKSPQLKNQIKQYLSLLAAKERITRLEMLRAKSVIVAKRIADIELRTEEDFLIGTVQDAYNQASAAAVISKATYDFKLETPTIEPQLVDDKEGVVFIDPATDKIVKVIDIKPNSGITEFKELSTKQTRDVLNVKWYGGNYSSRIWKNTDDLARRLGELFTAKQMSGMRDNDLSTRLQEEFSVSAYQARRLIRTEANFVAGQAKLQGWREHGVKRYVLVAVLDFRTSAICRLRDGQVFAVADAKCAGPDGNYPPFHSFCRTVATAYFGDKTFVGTHKFNNPLGKSIELPAGTTYREWEDALISKYGQEDINLAKRKVKNYSRDAKQYNKYAALMGDAMPDFDLFQNVKYDNGDEWVALNDHVFIKQRLSDGTFKNAIHWGKQNNHLTGEHAGANTKGKSLFDETVDVEALFKKYAGTGTVVTDHNGRRTPKERVTLDDDVGTDIRTGKRAHGISIHYSKKGAHLVPWRGDE